MNEWNARVWRSCSVDSITVSVFVVDVLVELTNTETAAATPPTAMQIFQPASDQWKVHQTGGKRLISPPTYSQIDVEQLVFTKVHHKVSKNGLKVRGGVAVTMKFGETEVCICSDWFSDFSPCIFHWFSAARSNWITMKFGEGFVFLLIHISDLCAISSDFSRQCSHRPGIFNALWNLFEMSDVYQDHWILEVMAFFLFKVVHLFHGNHSVTKYIIAQFMQFTIHIIIIT